MVMIFTLVSGAQEKLSDILDMLEKEKEEKAKQREEELQRLEEVCVFKFHNQCITFCVQAKFFGTPVTKENFLEWRKKFNEEMRLKMPSSTQSGSGLTGTCMYYIASRM